MTSDHLQAICWSVTYILLIIYSVKHKMHAIPLTAICLNFAWETTALMGSIINGNFSVILLIHVVWFSLDLVMVLLYMFYESGSRENREEKKHFWRAYILSTVCLTVLFRCGYMLLSCFVIDLIMAVSFVVFLIRRQCPRSWLLYLIGCTKLLGDLFAWQYYGSKELIYLIGICVLGCNIIYMMILLFRDVQFPVGKKG